MIRFGTPSFSRTPSWGRWVLLVSLVWLSACQPAADNQAQRTQPPPSVVIAQPIVKPVVVWDEYTGRFDALEQVEVRSRVSGYLQKVHFQDGSLVNKGDLLFVIDPRPAEAAVAQAEANVAEQRARLKLAQNQLRRAEKLFKNNVIAEDELDARRQEERAAEAELQSTEAALDAAKLDLEFTHIHAPISGRISEKFVSQGNLVDGGQANSTVLTTIVGLDPIQFYFDADEFNYLKYIRLSRAGKRKSARENQVAVYVRLSDEDGFPHEGYIDFVDNRLDEETGTIRARAVFENPDLLYTPGLFGKARLVGSPEFTAVMIPEEIVSADQSRRFVFVVGEGNKAEIRYLQLGPSVEGMRIVEDGLNGDEWIIVKGIQRARAGGEVAPEKMSLATGEPLETAQAAPANEG